MRHVPRARSWAGLAAAAVGLAVGTAVSLWGGPAHARPPELPVPKDLCERPGACGTIGGSVRAAGQRTPLADAAVIAVPASSRRLRAIDDPASDRPAWLREVRTGADGSLALTTPPGLVRLVIVAPGFERFEAVVEVRAGEVAAVKLFPRPLAVNPYRTVVRGASERARAPVAARTLSREEIATLPGTQGDPLRALQSLPGVARTPGGLGLLVLRGASPNQSQVFVGEHPVPRAFHVLSLASVVPADVIDRIDFVPGNFDSRYGNATGGVVVIEPRRGRRDGVHGFGELDLAAASALLEGPLGKQGGSFVVAGQRAYIDGVLLAAQKLLGAQDFLLPRYYDYQALFDHPLPGGGSISARAIGSGDRIRLRSDAFDAGGERQTLFDFQSNFHRVDVTARKRFEAWRFMVSPAFRYELGKRDVPRQSLTQARRDYVTSLRAEAVRSLSDRFELVFGADLQIDAYHANTVSGESGGSGSGPGKDVTGTETWLGAYTTAHLRLGPLLLTPGVRAAGFVVGSARAFAADPRLNGRLELGERWNLRFGVGGYSQPRVLRYTAEGRLVPSGGARLGSDNVVLPAFFANFEPTVAFDPLADTLRVHRALQASATVQHQMLAGYSIELTGFWREQLNGQPPGLSGQALPGATTRNYGLELLVRRPLTRRLYGWVAYTLMRSQLTVQGRAGQPDERYVADFDQRHNLAVVASYKLPGHWQIGGRFRLVSGMPYTPILGALQYEGSFQGIVGPYNSARFPPFHQLDLRVDKRWILRRTSVTAYLDIQNVYNRNNVEAYIYTYDYSSAAGGVGLPIFPSIGLRVDF